VIIKDYPKVVAASVVEKARHSHDGAQVAKQDEPPSQSDDKKRTKAELKAKKKAKKKADKVMEHRQMADESAEGVDMKTSDMVPTREIRSERSPARRNVEGLIPRDP
jgi:hypothetical protein